MKEYLIAFIMQNIVSIAIFILLFVLGIIFGLFKFKEDKILDNNYLEYSKSIFIGLFTSFCISLLNIYEKYQEILDDKMKFNLCFSAMLDLIFVVLIAVILYFVIKRKSENDKKIIEDKIKKELKKHNLISEDNNPK
ncbi:hypothetical protein [Aliarcobacter butzleri]|uniref:hypothetical protein n=1 Tax=Aliarcobacter butzleri TaxID=28197 RepID=UPI0021B40BCB|nr:hypothetical protein [Aliarcobacter butzleri]MCT7572194.1 hypothetical protein [Aliarcobacter butzleri]